MEPKKVCGEGKCQTSKWEDLDFLLPIVLSFSLSSGIQKANQMNLIRPKCWQLLAMKTSLFVKMVKGFAFCNLLKCDRRSSVPDPIGERAMHFLWLWHDVSTYAQLLWPESSLRHYNSFSIWFWCIEFFAFLLNRTGIKDTLILMSKCVLACFMEIHKERFVDPAEASLLIGPERGSLHFWWCHTKSFLKAFASQIYKHNEVNQLFLANQADY